MTPQEAEYDKECRLILNTQLYDQGPFLVSEGLDKTATYNGSYINPKWNNRRIAHTEAVLEYDTDDKNLVWQATNDAAIRLKEDNRSFYVFYHEKGRSPHTHIKGLVIAANMTTEQRRAFKRAFLLHYAPEYARNCIDFELANEHMIAMEYRLHWKHKTMKLPVYVHKGKPLTTLPEWAKEAVAKATEQKPTHPVTITQESIKNNRYLNYCLTHPLPDGTGRRKTLCKNFAALFVQAGLSDDEIGDMADRLIANMPGRKREDIAGWVKTIRAKGKPIYNPKEMFCWFRDHGGVLL